jgi:ABC-type Fe3+/spermidine/putrescine transport system ATPase subunit
MNAGHIEQIATPPEIYSRPSTVFVASFIGYSNVLEGIVTSAKGSWLAIRVKENELNATTESQNFRAGDEVLVFYKEEHVQLASNGENTFTARVSLTEYHGQTMIVHLESPIGKLRARIPANMKTSISVGMQTPIFLPPSQGLVFAHVNNA